jgi:hypothetical protein
MVRRQKERRGEEREGRGREDLQGIKILAVLIESSLSCVERLIPFTTPSKQESFLS